MLLAPTTMLKKAFLLTPVCSVPLIAQLVVDGTPITRSIRLYGEGPVKCDLKRAIGAKPRWFIMSSDDQDIYVTGLQIILNSLGIKSV